MFDYLYILVDAILVMTGNVSQLTWEVSPFTRQPHIDLSLRMSHRQDLSLCSDNLLSSLQHQE